LSYLSYGGGHHTVSCSIGANLQSHVRQTLHHLHLQWIWLRLRRRRHERLKALRMLHSCLKSRRMLKQTQRCVESSFTRLPAVCHTLTNVSCPVVPARIAVAVVRHAKHQIQRPVSTRSTSTVSHSLAALATCNGTSTGMKGIEANVAHPAELLICSSDEHGTTRQGGRMPVTVGREVTGSACVAAMGCGAEL
jgi:hypothetical protein